MTVKNFINWLNENKTSLMDPKSQRMLRKRLREKYGHRPDFKIPNENGHTPEEMLFWYYKSLHEGESEMTDEWKMHLKNNGWLR